MSEETPLLFRALFPQTLTPSLLCTARTASAFVDPQDSSEGRLWMELGGIGSPFIHSFQPLIYIVTALASLLTTAQILMHSPFPLPAFISNLQQFQDESSYFLSLHSRPPLQPPRPTFSLFDVLFSHLSPLFSLI